MSILIADSGSTKTEWCQVTPDSQRKIITEGLNPYYHTPGSIKDVLSKSLVPELSKEKVEAIYFYGAGCDSPEKDTIVHEALAGVFSDANLEVHHDLLGAAQACFLDDTGIACILGTGSNSCLYDGREIIEHIPSLAFILGDEGSAGWFGKKLINAYFRKELPKDLEEKLEAEYNMSLNYIMLKAYGESQKSRFVGSYASFLGDHSDHPFVRKMLKNGFKEFVVRVVKKYTNAQNHKISFVGSVAYAHQDLIKEILKEEGLSLGIFIKKPMDRLIEFHTQKGD
ncbi:MAG: hypothetical protein U5J95_06775 [Balneolaceae bacterium]|nr:hypothetical protein [Balneolaceae bacterium]